MNETGAEAVTPSFSMPGSTGSEAPRSLAHPVAPAGIPASARIFLGMLSRLRIGQLSVVLPSGERLHYGNGHGTPPAELRINDWRACSRILGAGDIGFGDALRRGWVESPDLTALLRLAITNETAVESAVWGGRLLGIWYRIRHALRANTRTGSRENIHAHYDLGNAFYGLWLDESWTYSSALFRGDFSLSLAAAQRAKYQRVMDVLELRPGMRVLEIGCGWGGFAQHAAERGVAVHGITISPAQLDVGRRRIKDADLENLVNLELRDYRDVTGQYDAIVSIEMFEAVGSSFWDGWFQALGRLLVPRGRALVQSITIDDERFVRYQDSSDFIRHYIFPGGMLPSGKRFIAAATRNGLVTRDIMAFGKDYAETMRRWRQQFETARDAILAQGFDEVFLRTWRLYLAYCEAGFEEGRTDVMQFLLERNDAR
jgi:cyclopropane-fatty-acyl-phospholipid synthase